MVLCYLIIAAGVGAVGSIIVAQKKNGLLIKGHEKKQQEIKEKYIETIKNDLKKNKEKFFDDEIKANDDKYLEEFRDGMRNVMKNEELKEIIEDRVNQGIKIMKLGETATHFNILLIGKTGAGKSTIINTILNLKEGSDNYAKEGTGTPVTMGDPKPYMNEEVKGIRLYDTRGIDMNQNITETFKVVQDLIKSKAESNDPDSFIHCIWYCVDCNCSRFEDKEREFVINLISLYHDKNLPVVIVLTKCTSEDDSVKMNEAIDEICKAKEELKNRKIDIIPVLARDKTAGAGKKKIPIPKFGIDKLLKKSFEKIKGAVRSACFQSIRQQITKQYDDSLVKTYDKITEELNNYLKAELKLDIPLKELTDKIIDLIKIMAKFLIFNGSEEQKLKEDSLNILKKEIEKYITFCNEKMEIFLQEIVIKTTANLINELSLNEKESKEKYNKANTGMISQATNLIVNNISILKKDPHKFKETEEIKDANEKEMKDIFSSKIENFFNNKISRHVASHFIALIKEDMRKHFENTIESDKFDEQLQKQFSGPVDEIYQKLYKILVEQKIIIEDN